MSVASTASSGAKRPGAEQRLAILALVVAAFAIASSPVLVRLSEVGPTVTAVYRMALGLPILALWWGFDRARGIPGTVPSRLNQRQLWLAGLWFAGDLAAWHWSIRLTTIANATLLANLSPFLVTIGARYMFGERVSRGFAGAAAGALVGGVILSSAGVHGRGTLTGDVLALVTAMFYAAYFLAMRGVRERVTTSVAMGFSGFTCALFLLPLALASGETLFPTSAHGWLLLFTLAMVGQILGQCLIAWALVHLPVSFSALSLLLQPIIATLLGWIVLGEPLSVQQWLGGFIILISLIAARRASLAVTASTGAP